MSATLHCGGLLTGAVDILPRDDTMPPFRAPPAPARFVAAARRYLRTPFRHFGRTPAGLDCVGLLLLAARDAGIPADDPGKYAKGRRGFDVRAWLRERLVELPADATPADGDVLLFADGIYPAHVGIASTLHLLPHVIHAHLRGGMVVEEPFAHDLARSYRAAYRLREG